MLIDGVGVFCVNNLLISISILPLLFTDVNYLFIYEYVIYGNQYTRMYNIIIL